MDKDDIDLSALRTILALIRKKASKKYMAKLRPDKPKKSVEEIVSETVQAEEKSSKREKTDEGQSGRQSKGD